MNVDPNAYRPDYERDGFVIVPGFATGAGLDLLRENLDRYIREIVPGVPATDAFYQDRSRPETLRQMHHLDRDAFFADLMSHPDWLALAEVMLGEPIGKSHGVEWFNKPPGTEHATPPHQDNYYFCLQPPSVLTLWVAMDAIDEENGCLHYVRGSHLRGVRDHAVSSVLGFSQSISDYGPADEALEVATHLNPGDALVHHGNTIHRADANRSMTRHRSALAMVVRGVSAQVDQAATAAYNARVKEQQARL